MVIHFALPREHSYNDLVKHQGDGAIATMSPNRVKL